MAQITTYDGTPITDAIVIGPDGQPGYSQTATLGTPGFSQVIVDDPEGTMTFETWKDWTVDEDDCTFERLYTGIVFSKRVIRGPYRDGPARQWQLEIVDLGQLLYQRAISGDDGNRPEEDDTERVAWLIASDYLDGIVFDNGFVNVTDNPQNFFDADYRGQYPMDVLVSIAAPISKYAFVYWDEVAEQPSLFYDRWNVDLGAAGIGFSNVMSDVDEATVFYPKVDAEASYVGEDRYGGLMLMWRGPTVYRQDASTVADMGRVRDVVFQTDRIGRATTASTVTDLMLAQHEDDLVSITFSAEVPSSVVNLARPGQRMEVRFSHIPGFETTQEVFIRSTIVQQMQAGRYLVQYEVAPDPHVPLVPTGGDPGDLPDSPCGDGEIVQSVTGEHSPDLTLTFANTPTVGNLLVFAVANRENSVAGAITGWTLHPDGQRSSPSGDEGSVATYYRVATGDPEDLSVTTNWDQLNLCRGALIEVDFQAATLDDASEGITEDVLLGTGGTVTPTSGISAFMFTVIGYNTGGENWPGPVPTPTTGATTLSFQRQGTAVQHPVVWTGYQFIQDTSGSYEHEISVGGFTPNGDEAAFGQSIIFAGNAGCACPETGQWVESEVVNLSGADGVTACPFADNSLHVFIDNVEQTANLISQDGSTGEFTLGFDPTPTEVCTVRYQGR